MLIYKLIYIKIITWSLETILTSFLRSLQTEADFDWTSEFQYGVGHRPWLHTPPTVITGPDLSPFLHSHAHFFMIGAFWITFYKTSWNTRILNLYSHSSSRLTIHKGNHGKRHIHLSALILGGTRKINNENRNLSFLPSLCFHHFFIYSGNY